MEGRLTSASLFRPYLLTSVAPRCQGSVGAIVGAVPGVISLSPGESVAAAHQGRHSKAAQYRRMKAEWKSNVYLARSRIQVRRRRLLRGKAGTAPCRTET